MSDIKLGELITGDGQRDAIHVALAPVTANERLRPGQHVGFAYKHSTELVGISQDPIGIIDPFLERSVERVERCYLLLYQNTVTGMRHQWEHPAFGSPDADVSRQWLEDLADEIGFGYDWLLEGIAEGSINTRDREVYGARESEDIRRHYENVTGLSAPREIHFRCAC